MQPGPEPGPYRHRLRSDPLFALELKWCSEHGIRHSEYLSWSPEDRAKLVASLLHEAEKCAMCGTASWEWEEDRRAYVPGESFCPGCHIKRMAEEDASVGTLITLIPTRGQEAAKRLMEQKRAWERSSQSDEDSVTLSTR